MWKHIVKTIVNPVRSTSGGVATAVGVVAPRSASSVTSPSSIFVRHPQPPPLYIEEHVAASASSAAVAPSSSSSSVGVVPRTPSSTTTSGATTTDADSSVPLKGAHQFDHLDSNAAQTLANELHQQMSTPDPLFIDRPMPTMPSPMYLKAGQDPLPILKQMEPRMSLHFHALPWAPWPKTAQAERLYAYRGNMVGSYPLQPSPDDSLHQMHPHRMSEAPTIVRGRRSRGQSNGRNGAGKSMGMPAHEARRRMASLLIPSPLTAGKAPNSSDATTAAAASTAAANTASEEKAVDTNGTPLSVPSSFQAAMTDLYQQAIGGVKRLFDTNNTATAATAATAATTTSSSTSIMDDMNDTNDALEADSVKRKRVLKMKRHKLKKRAKKERNKNIGAK